MLSLGINNVFLSQTGKTLMISLEFPTVVLYKAKGQVLSSQYEKAMSQLAMDERRVKFAIFDVTDHQQVAVMSRQTTTAINPPMIVGYLSGSPKLKYAGKADVTPMQAFVDRLVQADAAPSPSHSFYDPYKTVVDYKKQSYALSAPSDTIPHNKPWLADE